MSASNYGLVAFLKPPSLEAIDQPSLIRFETSYSAYIAKIEDVNKDRSNDEQILPASIKDCFNANTLHTLCILGEIEGATSVDEATIDAVQKWFDTASTLSTNDLSERVDATVKGLVYTSNKEDPSGGVYNFIIDVIRALDRNNASDDLSYPKPDYHLCLFTDVSDSNWASVLTQVHEDDRSKELENQQHEPL